MTMPSISDSAVKAILAVAIILAVIAGFFMKLIDSTIFMTVAATIITHYFNDKRLSDLQDQVSDKDDQIQTLNNAKVETIVHALTAVDSSDGKKTNIPGI